MATTTRKSTGNAAARPRALALAVATAFLPWYLPQTTYAQAPDPNTLPTGGQITNGAGQIHAPQGTHLQIDQYTQKMIAEFGSFSIGANASVNLSQPGASSIALFRDVGGDPSKIFGNLTANGQLFISNQNGVLFGASARVDVGALFATSLSITDHDFMAGRYHWYNEGNAGSVVNQGQIVTANGYTALVGPQVRNDGIIIARAGSVALAAGDRVSLDMIGDGLISVSVEQSAYNASVINTGSITADGGTVLLTARSANALLDTVINNSGTIRANSLVERNGEIVLDGGNTGVVAVSGTLQAAGVDAGTTGGTIKVLGDKVGLFGSALIDASGDVGGGTVLVGGNWQGQGDERNASAAFMGSGVSILADARTAGHGGTIVVWSEGSTKAFGFISARGGQQSGNGGSVETSGHYLDIAGARVDTSAPNGMTGDWLLDPYNVTIANLVLTGSTGGAFGGGDPNTWTPNATGSTVADADIEANLATASVIITTVNGAGAETGDITVNSDVSITWANVNTLTLNAEGNITLLGNANFTGPLGTLAFNVGQANGGGTLTIPGTATLAVANVNAVGGTGNDTFNIGAWGAAGSINGAAGNDTFNINAGFTANLIGGANDDSFVFANGAVLTGTIDGNAGSDTINWSAYAVGRSVVLTATGATDGFNGTEASVSGGFSNIDVLSGSAGTDSLTGINAVATWGIDGSNTYTSTNTLSFSSFEALTGGNDSDTFNISGAQTHSLSGGAGADSFVFADAATLTGTIDGNAGGDTLDLSAYTTALTVNLTAAGGTDGANGTTAGTPNPVNGGFSNIDVVSGGTNGNTFNVTAVLTANVSGGAGADVFDIDAALTGSVSGAGGSDTLQGTQITDVTLASSDGNGFSGSSAAVTFSGINVITGAGGGTLTGENVASTWALDGTPTYFDGTTTLDITGFTTLAGGTAIDTFDVTVASAFALNGGDGVDVFNLNATLTGSVDGQGNGATLDGTNVLSANLTGAGGTIGYNGSTDAGALSGTFSNITTINGNGGGTLTGTANASAWSLNGTGGSYTDNAGTNSVAFTGMSTLQGGAAIDAFTLAAASTFNLLGGDGVDVFALGGNTLTGAIAGEAAGGSITGVGGATLTNAGTTTGFDGTSANVSGNFTDITNLSGTGTLTGDDAVSSWAVNGTSGTYTSGNALTFSGFATLQGGTAVDTFTLGGATTFNLNGGDGVDVFALGGNTLTGSINGQIDGGSITGIGSATLTNAGTTTGFDGTSANVSGSFTDITSLSGTGTLTGDDAVSSWAVNGTSGTYTSGNALTFSGFATLQGGTAVDTFTLTGNAAANLAGGDGVDVFDIGGFTLTGSVAGQGAGATLSGVVNATLTAAGATTGFDGSSTEVSLGFTDINTINGTGTLQGLNTASSWDVDANTYTDTVSTRALSHSGFATLQGGSAIDTFSVSATAAKNLAGGDGVDVFDLGAALTGTIDGQAAGGTLDGTQVVNATLTAAGATAGFDGTTDAAALVGTFSNITTINANGGGTLTGTNNASGWSLNGTSGTYTSGNLLSFSGFGTLQGGTAIDAFTLAAASTFNLLGGDGVDVFALGGNTLTGAIAGEAAGGSITGVGSATLTNAGTTSGFDGTSANVSGNFTDITSLSGTGTLTGDDAVSSWAVSGTSGTYTSGNALSFSGFATLQGGTAVDTFTLGGATTFNLNGGDGVDVFALGGNTLTGAIAGQAAGGSITGLGSATLTNAGATTGFDGTSANVSGNFTDITSLSGTGTLTGDDVASTWALDGTPTYSDGTRTLDIAGFASLQGGTAMDTFNVTAASAFNLLGGAGADVFTINAALTGSVSGETGSDTLQGTQIASTTLTASTATDGFSGTTTGLTGFSGINVLNGSGTLTGRNVASTWSVDGATYTDGTATLTHSGFGTLQGGTGIDTFNLAAAATANLMGGDGADVFNVNAALTGSVNGEVGNDTLSGGTIYVVNAANAGTASNVSGGFSNIENLSGTAGADTFTLSGGTLAGTVDGLAGTDTLTGGNVANTWTITGPNSGTLTGTGGWVNIENLVGGTSTDSFSGVPAGSVGGTISDGGGGATTLSGTINSSGSQTYAAAVSSAGVTLNAGTAAILATNAGNNFTGPLSVTGSSASITDLNALTIGANLTGGLTTVSGALTYAAGTSVGSLNSTASGAVNQTGPITVTGATSINAGGNSITLTSANDFQGTVSLTGGTTQIRDTNSLTLGNVSTGALTTLNTGALNLGSGTVNGALSSNTNGGNITQTGALGVTDTTSLQAGAGSIVLAMANDFGGAVAASGIGIIVNDVNTLTPGTINAGTGSVSLSANSLGAGGTVSAGSASSLSSNTNVNGLDINMPNVPLALSGAATQWNFTSTPTSIPQPNPVTVPGGNVGVSYNLASIIASVAQQQAASASSSVSATVAAVIVEEANKTFGTDSVAEDVEYGFAGEVGTTPPMDHRIDESGISLPRCVQESREGMPCK